MLSHYLLWALCCASTIANQFPQSVNADGCVVIYVDEDGNRIDPPSQSFTTLYVTSTSTTTALVTHSNVVSSASSSSKNAAATSSAHSTSSSLAASSSSGTTAPVIGAGGPSALVLPDVLPGVPAFIINEDYIHAPVDDSPVPPDAHIFVSEEEGIFDPVAWTAWAEGVRDGKDVGSKWLKVKPGYYSWKLGPEMPDGSDPNNVSGENIVMWQFRDGWTLDLRGVTFYMDITPNNVNRRPSVVIYCNGSPNLTILGGTIWIDKGEIYTQARITETVALSDGRMHATVVVEEGYDVATWRSAGPRNVGCVSDANPDHYTNQGCNGWRTYNWNWDNLETSLTFEFDYDLNFGWEKGLVLYMSIVTNLNIAVSNEANADLVVKGLTTNSVLFSIGNNGQTVPSYGNVYQVNPPPRPGFAPRALGPMISWNNVNKGQVYNGPDMPEATVPGSFFQYSGSTHDLIATYASPPDW